MDGLIKLIRWTATNNRRKRYPWYLPSTVEGLFNRTKCFNFLGRQTTCESWSDLCYRKNIAFIRHVNHPVCTNFHCLKMELGFSSHLYFEFCVQWLARKLIFKKGCDKHDATTYAGMRKIRKFKESAWKCIYFLSGELLALLVTYNEQWFTNTRNFWVGPGDQVWPDQKIKYVVDMCVLLPFIISFALYKVAHELFNLFQV